MEQTDNHGESSGIIDGNLLVCQGISPVPNWATRLKEWRNNVYRLFGLKSNAWGDGVFVIIRIIQDRGGAIFAWKPVNPMSSL
jgi:hypothetical protein